MKSFTRYPGNSSNISQTAALCSNEGFYATRAKGDSEGILDSTAGSGPYTCSAQPGPSQRRVRVRVRVGLRLLGWVGCVGLGKARRAMRQTQRSAAFGGGGGLCTKGVGGKNPQD